MPMHTMLRYWAKLYEQTDSERAIEPAIAALGRRYRSQHPFWGMSAFADFALIDDKIVIEVDGASHDRPAQKEKDLLHMLEWSKRGWKTVRITNESATREPETAIRAAVLQRPDGSLVARPPQASEVQLQEALDQLREDYPQLLAAAARRPKRGRPRRIASRPAPPARKRGRPAGSRTQSAPDRGGVLAPKQTGGLAAMARW